MKKRIFTFLLAGLVIAGASAQTLLYSNDFEEGLSGATIVGNGAIVDAADASRGKVFHNAAGGQAVRANYLLLPSTLFADLKNSEATGLSISFWVNKGTATGFYWSPLFSAYGAAPNPNNTWPMMVLQTRGVAQVNAGGTWTDYVNEQNVNGTNAVSTAWIDNNNWHFYTAVFTATNLKVYINGSIVNEWALDGNVAGGSAAGLFSIGDGLPYVALGGNQAWNWNDPDPAFMYDKLKIYAGALSASQVNSLMANDQLSAPVLTVNATNVYLDDIYNAHTITINGAELSEDITLSAPVGVTVTPSVISKDNAENVAVVVSFDGTTILTGDITISSGTMSRTVVVKTSTTANFSPAYPSGNMIADPTFSAASLAAGGYGGWGPTGIDYKNPYSGRGSAYIRGTCWPDGGSIDRGLTAANGNVLKPNTKYRLRAMLKAQAAVGKFFQFEIEGYNGTASLYFPIGQTNGWQQFDTTFVTGASVTVGKGIYFNSCSSSSPALTDTAFIDNYELYEVDFTTNLPVVNSSSNRIVLIDNAVIAEFRLQSAQEVTFSVFDLQGKSLYSISQRLEAGAQRFTLDVSLSKGLYLVKMHSPEFTSTQKTMIQ